MNIILVLDWSGQSNKCMKKTALLGALLLKDIYMLISEDRSFMFEELIGLGQPFGQDPMSMSEVPVTVGPAS